MLNAYERQLILFYLSNAAAHFHHSVRGRREELAEWVTENRDLLALSDETEEPGEHQASRPYEKELSTQEWKHLRKTLEEEYAAACNGGGKDRTARRLCRLGQEMDLAPEDIAFLEIVLCNATQPIFVSLIDCFESDHRYRQRFFNVTHPVLPCTLGIPASAFRARFAADAPLMKSGLVSVDDDGDIKIVRRLLRLVSVPDDSDLDMCSLLLDAATPGELEWSDCDHVAEERDYIEKVIKGALSTGKPGVNILVYGPPGAGKTEFCKTLAARLGANLYTVGEEDERCDPKRHERLQELRLSQRLLASVRGSILLFDEMEDLLSDPGSGWMPFSSHGFPHLRAGGSKMFLNRLLERTTGTDAVDLKLRPPDLSRCPAPHDLRLRAAPATVPSPGAYLETGTGPSRYQGDRTRYAHSLAKEFNVTPGVASGAIAAAGLCGGDLTAVRLGVRSLSQVIFGKKPPANQGPPDRYDPVLIRADINPIQFADRLAKHGGKHFSLCLQGPPGTGKSAFVRYLADRLGLQVTQKRASDLLSMWVGKTEELIAEAFAEARAEGSILVFDEADSLLADRQGAVRSWEISQVNEMLTWMEIHPLPFACTTNFGDNLDPASLRRFTFKIALNYLTPDQSQAAFRIYFALNPPPELGDLTILTPGDFAVVRRKAEFLGHLQDTKALTELLRTECEAKPNHSRKMGF